MGDPITTFNTWGDFHKDPFIFSLNDGKKFYLIWGNLCTLYYQKFEIQKDLKIVQLKNDTDNNVLLSCKQDRNIWAPSLYYNDGQFYLYYSEGQNLGADVNKDLSHQASAWQSYNIYYKTVNAPNGRIFTNDILSAFSNNQDTLIAPIDQAYHDFGGITAKNPENQRHTYGIIDPAIVDKYMYYVVVPYWIKNYNNVTIRPHQSFIRRRKMNNYTNFASDWDESACNTVNGLNICDAVIAEYDGVIESPSVFGDFMAISVRPTDKSQQIYVIHGKDKNGLFKSDGNIYLYNPSIPNGEKYEMERKEYDSIKKLKNIYNIGGQDMSLIGNDLVMAFQAKVRNQKFKWDLFLQVIYSE